MMADEFTNRETAIVTILTANLASTYICSNKDSINLGTGTHLYNVLVNWVDFDNELNEGTNCFETDRENYRIICTPISGVNDNDAGTQCNKMASEVRAILRNSALVNAATIDPGEDLTEFRVTKGEKGKFQKRLSVQLTFSFLVDG